MIDHYLSKTVPPSIDLPWPQETNFLDPNYYHYFKTARQVRKPTQSLGIYALVAQDWVNAVAERWIKERTCLEVMTGTGILALALRNAGVDVIATDDMSWEIKHNFIDDIKWCDARHATHIYRDREILIMCWPPQGELVAHECLKRWKGKPVIYIGEHQGGCTADDRFHEHFNILDEIEIPNYYSFYDKAYLGEYQ